MFSDFYENSTHFTVRNSYLTAKSRVPIPQKRDSERPPVPLLYSFPIEPIRGICSAQPYGVESRVDGAAVVVFVAVAEHDTSASIETVLPDDGVIKGLVWLHAAIVRGNQKIIHQLIQLKMPDLIQRIGSLGIGEDIYFFAVRAEPLQKCRNAIK